LKAEDNADDPVTTGKLTLPELHYLTMLSARPLELAGAAAAAGFDYSGFVLIAPILLSVNFDTGVHR
jgi:hypothetical protein